MNKKLLLLACASFFSFTGLESSCAILPEIKLAYYYPTSSRTRDLYTGSGLYSFELSVETWCDFYPWVSAGYLHATGHTKAENRKTTLEMVPLNLGVKYIASCWGSHPYLGLGVTATYMHTKDNSPYVIHTTSKWGVGGIVKAGFLAYMSECMFIDLFIDYTFVRMGFHNSSSPNVQRRSANLSGFSFGGGFGWAF